MNTETTIRKIKCWLGLHKLVYHSHGVLGKASVYYGETCKYCGKGNVTFFGKAYRRRNWWE